jgi:hypothetical protein
VQGIAGVAFHISIKLTELRALIVPQKPLVSLSRRFSPPRTEPHCAASRRQEERTLRQYIIVRFRQPQDYSCGGDCNSPS